MKHIKHINLATLLIIFALFSELQAANLPNMLDRLQLGKTESETEHRFWGKNTNANIGLLNESCRVLNMKKENSTTENEIRFTMKVDPQKQNYFTLKYSGSSPQPFTNEVFVDNLLIGVGGIGDDYPAINEGFGAALPGRFIYSTIVLPLNVTMGKSEVTIRVQTLSNVDANCEFYKAYTHTMPYLDFADEPQGIRPVVKVRPDISEADKSKHLNYYRQLQNEDFQKMCRDMDENADTKLSIHKYSSNLRAYCLYLIQDWNSCKTPAEKRIALNRIFKTIDNWVKNYYQDYRIVLRGGHQGDWGGYLGALGEALYIVEPLIKNDQIMGEKAFGEFLAEPFSTGTKDTEYSLSDKDPITKQTITRKQAWERALKANFDFSRSRLSYIYNQVFYCYSGAWKSQIGLGIIHSQYYEGRERAHQIFGEMLGFYPFLGEEVIVGPNGEELDLFHSLFRHDKNAQFTDDVVYIVAKGLAKSKLDSQGKVVRRMPYGKHYTGLSSGGLTRENGYVFNYGETANYLPEFFWLTLNHPEDSIVNDEILKASLNNLNGRSNTRYTDLDDQGFRTMYPTTILDERRFPWRKKTAYAAVGDRMMLFASLAWYMNTHPTRYEGKEWDKYKLYAAKTCGWTRQYLGDNFLFPPTDKSTQWGKINSDMRRIMHLPETYKYLMQSAETAQGYAHPFTDFRYYQADELKNLHLTPKEYDRYGWSDIDTLMIDLRDGNTQVHAVLCFRSKGYGANGRAFVVEDRYTHVSHLGVRSKFAYNDVYLRMSGRGHAFVHKFSENYQFNNTALQQELIPICFQKGVGKVVRENFEVDTPYAGYPDYVESLYKNFLMAINTTRKEYQNEQVFEVKLPVGCKLTTVLDLISGKELTVQNGKVSIPPMTAYALKLDRSDYEFGTPSPVDVVLPLQSEYQSITLNWKAAPGAVSYTIFRDGAKVSENLKSRIFVDKNTIIGKTHTYTISAVDAHGNMSWPSYPRMITVKAPASLNNILPWRDDIIGNAQGGKAILDNNAITIENAGGSGLGGGNDMRPEMRNLPDSLHYVHRIENGSIELKAKLYTNAGNKMQGLLLRDNLNAELGRYFFIGSDAQGNLFVANRSRDTRYELEFINASPHKKVLEGLSVENYPWLKITRNATTGMTAAWYSEDGKNWKKATEIYTPLPEVYHAGFAVAGGYGNCKFININNNPDK